MAVSGRSARGNADLHRAVIRAGVRAHLDKGRAQTLAEEDMVEAQERQRRHPL
jgi:hypothetical protein